MKPAFPLLALLMTAVSCATKSEEMARSQEIHKKPLMERITEENGYKQDAEGNWKPRNDKRSSFESQGENAYFKKDGFNKSAYKAGDYAKTSFWGNRTYDRKAYAGNTDGSRFQQKSDFQNKVPRELSQRPDLPGSYDTGTYATDAARESGLAPVKKGSNREIENRRRVFAQPDIIDWKEQRKISLEESKGILGN